MRTSGVLAFVLLVCFAPYSSPAGPQEALSAQPPNPSAAPAPKPPGIADLPEGFSEEVVATGLTGATAMAVAPDGRVFVCEQTGALRVVKGDALLDKPFVTLKVDSSWERGLIGVALAPGFPKAPYIYLCYVSPDPYPHHVVSRFTANGDVAVPDSEVVLLKGDDQSKLGGQVPNGHQGGAVHFGKDGKLYVGIGEQTTGLPSQKLDTFLGKLLRINADGSIPEDNPFFKTAAGKYRAIWAYGLRNPFAFAVQPGTGRILINDVGEASWEEIDEGAAGANYGWPHAEGPSTDARFKGPLYAYDHGQGKSITGGAFYNPPVVQFPKEYAGKYFFADFINNWVRVIDPDHPTDVRPFAAGLTGPVDVQVGPDGGLYILNRNAWVKDDHFKPNTGSLHRIFFVANSGKPAPMLTTQPADQTTAAGQPATFAAAANGEAPLRYQWQRDGKDIPGATESAYTFPAPAAAANGVHFRCVATNKYGTARSRAAALWVVDPRPSAGPRQRVAGLEYAYYEGRWAGLPDFGSLKPAKTGKTPAIDLTLRGRGEDFGFTFHGFVEAPRDGAYTFTLRASGAAKLFVAANEAAGTSPAPDFREAHGTVGLKAGPHPFLLLYAHTTGRPELQVRWSGPGMGDEPLPSSALIRADPDFMAAPDIAPKGGEFSGPVEVRLATTAADATVRYTTDGADPSADSPRYLGPFLIDRPATVRARAFAAGGASPDASAAFRISGNARYGLASREVATTLVIPADPAALPPLLSQTGIFRSLAELTPNPGIIPYEVNAPLWSDGAVKRRWVALPGDSQIAFAPTGAWRFPAGTVFIKHFELPIDEANPQNRRRLETRVLVVDRYGGGYGAAYKWRPDGTDADLITDGVIEDVPVRTANGVRRQPWSYPSRNDCLVCHTPAAKFVLGVNTRQLNADCAYPGSGATDNQLRAWNHAGLFREPLREADIPGYDRLAAVSDAAATLERRIRSYLDSNCAQCHQPGGARTEFDARFDAPLDRQRLVNGAVVSSNLGVSGVKLVVPGDPDRSMLYLRMKRRQDVFGMPPLATQEVDPAALRAVAAWIHGLRAEAPAPRLAAPPAVAPGRFDKVRALLQQNVDRKQVAGAVALVLHQGKPVFSVAIGSADLEAHRPMAGDSIFRIASMTKPVTSVAVLMLAEEGRFELSDPVSKFLPEFKDMRVLDPKGSGVVAAARQITIHDLLTHTSGLAYGFLAGDALGPQYREAKVSDGLAPADGSLAENVRRLAGLPLKNQPGTAWEYGLSADVLGRLVEVVSGKSLDEFFRERIFDPLGMTDTSFVLPPRKRDRLAALYRPGANKLVEEVVDDPARVGTLTFSPSLAYRGKDYFSGGAGLVSTAPDYARFLQMLLNKGELDGKRILKPETVERMTRNQIGDLKVAIGGHGDGFGYGFGVVTAAGRGKEVASAGTFSWGGIYNTYFWADPAKEVVGVLMTQLYPYDHLSIREDFKRLTNEALADGPSEPTASGGVRVSEVTLHGDMECFKIETPTATYVYGKKGAGFASIFDKDGNDWISYHTGDKSKGEYHGLPKCGQPTKFFHCGYGYGMYKTENVFTSRVAVQSANHVRIESETADKKTACAWDFYPTHATLTLQRIDMPTYWFLYEGTPGGKLDVHKDFVIRPDGTKTTLNEPWSQVVPWVCFGAPETKAGFVCVNHQEPEKGETDSYVSWPFEKEKDGSFQDMTVFGFGRKGYKELVEHVPDLKRLPARFSIGFIDAADYKTAKAACEAIRNPPNK